MAVNEIPRQFEYECDVCGAKHLQQNAGGHYTDSRPPHWARLEFRMDAYDFQGAAVADGSVRRLLCDGCSIEARQAVNKWADEKRLRVGRETTDAK